MNPSIPFASFRPIRVTLVLTLALLAGCKKHSDGDGHNHGAASTQAGDKHSDEDGHGHSEGGHADEVKLTADAVQRYGVAVEKAQLWALRPTVIAPARIGFNTEAMAHVGSPLTGRVAEIKVRLGDSVVAGQELLVIESPGLGEAQADLLQKRTAVSTLAPTIELAKTSWERARTIYDQSRGISLTDVQEREAQYKAAVASQQAAEAASVAASSRLQLLGMTIEQIGKLAETGQINPRFAIKASIDGVVVQREATLGELVGPDRESLIVLADTRMLWLLADVPESELSGLTLESKAWITLGSQTLVSDNGAANFEGQVAFIAPLVDPTTRTAQVRINIPAQLTSGATIKPGMFAQAEIVLFSGGEPKSQIAVPDEAIQTVEGGPAVFVPVKGEPNTFAKRAISVGPRVGGLVPILSGLVEGEAYVTKGTFILKAELGKGSAAHEH